MPMDGLTVRALTRELNSSLKGARADRINQPESDEIIINFFSKGENKKLLLCSNASFPRVNVTSAQKSNPAVPPAFCMLLRKRLTGAHLTSVSQPLNERIVNLTFDTLNDFNEPETLTLIIEIMGKYSNIILVDGENKIIDSIRRVSSSMSRMRCVLPGLKYELPPSQGKLDPFSCTSLPENVSPRYISDSFTGISKQTAEEFTSSYIGSFQSFVSRFDTEELSPVILTDESGAPVDFYPFRQIRFSEEFQQSKSSLSEAIDSFYLLRDRTVRVREKSKDLKMRLQTLIEKSQKKRIAQQEKENECAQMEKYRIGGELITANIYKISRGDGKVTVFNYYTSQDEDIPLDVKLSPSANAQKYFKTYAKLKTASKLLKGQIEETLKETEILTEMADNLELCENEDDIADIKSEMVSLGFLRKKSQKQKTAESNPMHFISSEGADIFVGKNNIQNDRLTMHFASSDDLWLHAKDIHGSHVVIRGDVYGDVTVTEAANLAVYYSKARFSSNVPVDAAKRRFIKKPSGSPLGKVTYTNQTTYYITPDENLIKKIKKL